MLQAACRQVRRSFRIGASLLQPRFASSASKDILQGSVGQHNKHIVLFTGRNYDTIPSHINAVSPLYEQLVAKMQDAASPLNSYALAVTDATHRHTQVSEEDQWDVNANRFDKPAYDTSAKEAYGAVVYPDRREVPFPITDEAIRSNSLDKFLSSLDDNVGEGQAAEFSEESHVDKADDIDVFVCTHGPRDCRCGDVGSAFYESLVHEVERRQVGNAPRGFSEGRGPIRIHRTTHIGGHRYAATCFTSTGDWYGLLSATDASTFIDHLLKKPSSSSPLAHIWWEKWRGRAGLSQEQQLALADEGFADQVSSLTALDVAKNLKQFKRKRSLPLGDQVDIVFHRYDGEKDQVRAYEGETLMECAKRHELVEATCGGACECATCHVYLEPPTDGGIAAPVPDTTDEEEDQLEYAIGATDDSRLACQVVITKDLAQWLKQGGVVRLPRY